MLEWAIATINHHRKLEDLWSAAIKKRDYHILELLRVHKPIAAESLQDFTVQNMDVELLRWLDLYFPGAISYLTMEIAAYERNLEVVKYILDNHPTLEFGQRPFEYASQGRELAMLRCLFVKRPTQVGRNFVKNMMSRPNYGELDILRDVGGFEDVAREVAESHIANGYIEELRDLVTKGLLLSGRPLSIDAAAASSRMDLIQLLQEWNVATATTDSMDKAAEMRKWDVVKYLHQHRSEGCTTRVMDAAAAQGLLDELTFYHENRSEGCSTRAMDAAAGAGKFEIVKFLHELRREGCTTRAMDTAAGNGMLRVVKFLHEHRREGCTANAMKLAARIGHLDVIRFLHFTRGVPCTLKAVKEAVKSGCVDVISFFYEHSPSLFGHKFLYGVLLHGAFSVWKDLHKKYPDQANAVVERVVLEASKEYQLATIHVVVKELGREDLAHVVVDGAASEEWHDRKLQWLRAVMAITGPQSCRLSAVRNSARHVSSYYGPTALEYLISVCSESGAIEAAIETATEMGTDVYVSKALETWVRGGSRLDLAPLHPLLLIPQCPRWVVLYALDDMMFQGQQDPYSRCELPISWAIHVVYNDERVVLEYLRGLQSSDRLFTLDGACAAAIRKGNLPLLQWLLTDCDLTVESTLLDEALYYHQFEIAEWLVANCIETCRELDWKSKVAVPWLTPCGLADGVLLGWIENNTTVRSLIDFGGIAHYALRCGDVTSLQQLHETHPELYTTRDDLALTAQECEHNKVLEFLEEINYPFRNGI